MSVYFFFNNITWISVTFSVTPVYLPKEVLEVAFYCKFNVFNISIGEYGGSF